MSLEILEQYMNDKGFHCWECETGVSNLSQLCEDMGYDGDVCGTALTNFLADNSGVIEAMSKWISDHMADEWKESLSSENEQL